MVTSTASLWLASPQLSQGQGSSSWALAPHVGDLPSPVQEGSTSCWAKAVPNQSA